MYETWHLGAAYVVGTAAGIGIFREWIKEKIITATIDSLATQGYLHATEGPDGMVMLTKVDEVVEQAVTDVKVDAIIREAERMEMEIEDLYDEDDTP